jgi:uncharacterized protein YggU (UPF0235/DUF167 family)
MKPKRTFLLAGAMAIALLGVNLWSGWVLVRAKSQAQDATANAQLCRQLASRITDLQAKPVVAAAGEQATQELTARIETAAHSLGIAGDNLASIAPASAARVSDTAYLEKPTTVQLRQVTLSQLVSLLCNLAGDGRSLRIKELRLTTPPQKENSELWSAEITIAYLIYSPAPPTQIKGEL